MEFDDLIGHVLEREGGYVDHHADRGGPTNFGITQRVYSDWLAVRGMTWKNVRELTQDEAVRIYFANYWQKAGCAALPPKVRDVHFDAAVNHGVRRAAMMLQMAAGATQDGLIGKQTMAAVAAMNADLLRYRYIVVRYRFYGKIVNRDRSQIAFIAGWMRRMEDFA